MMDKTTYENMDALAAAVPEDAEILLVRTWRRGVAGYDIRPELRLIRELVPPVWRPLVGVTRPTDAVLRRWEIDHGYLSR